MIIQLLFGTGLSNLGINDKNGPAVMRPLLCGTVRTNPFIRRNEF
jgi:hypothetical protein